MASLAALTSGHAGQDFDSLVDSANCVYVELSICDSRDYIRSQHQIAQIGLRHQNALSSRKPFEPADIVKTFDLPVNAADRLNLTVLIDRAGDRQTLFDRDIGQARENGIEFRGGGAVTIDAI